MQYNLYLLVLLLLICIFYDSYTMRYVILLARLRILEEYTIGVLSYKTGEEVLFDYCGLVDAEIKFQFCGGISIGNLTRVIFRFGLLRKIYWIEQW